MTWRVLQLLEDANRPEVDGWSRDVVAEYRRLISSVSRLVEVDRRLSVIGRRLRDPQTRYSVLVDDLQRLDCLMTSLDDETALERQALPVLQVRSSNTGENVTRIPDSNLSTAQSLLFDFTLWSTFCVQLILLCRHSNATRAPIANPPIAHN